MDNWMFYRQSLLIESTSVPSTTELTPSVGELTPSVGELTPSAQSRSEAGTVAGPLGVKSAAGIPPSGPTHTAMSEMSISGVTPPKTITWSIHQRRGSIHQRRGFVGQV
eukprot:9427932-Pyramimonas_sp.AAC.1